jgi:organic radical activating enzyme
MGEELRYPLAPGGVFRTIQGEGALLGLPTIFVRLAGCSVGCEGCDTDYSVASRATPGELLDAVSRHYYGAARWLWLTGGEPTDHDLGPLLAGLRSRFPGLKLALATAGVRPVKLGWGCGGWDFVSVSPHDPLRWAPGHCSQVNLVPGLGGLSLADPALLDILGGDQLVADYKYVTPKYGCAESMAACRAWVESRPGWRLGAQAHKAWGVA